MLGADVGGTKVVAGLVGPGDVVLHRQRLEIPARGTPTEVTSVVADCLKAVRRSAHESPTAVGVGLAAQVDPRTGFVFHAPNLRWRDFSFGPALADLIGLPVVVVNDVQSIALAEWRFGAGRGCSDLLCLCIGTGAGGGIVMGGELARGATYSAGEVGHTTLFAQGRPCHCPNRGCFEAYIGGWAIEERLREAVAADPVETRRLVDSSGGVDALTPLALERAARQGDPFAVRFVHRLAEEFACGVVGLVNALNPERVVVTGRIVEGFPEYVEAARRAVPERCQPSAAGAKVLLGALGVDAGILGGALFARDLLRSSSQ